MPANAITVNGSEELTWYVNDSDMELFLSFIKRIGWRDRDVIKTDLSLHDKKPSLPIDTKIEGEL